MTPPLSPQGSVCIENFDVGESVCEPEPCVTVRRLVEDPVSQSSYIGEFRECLEIVRRVPNLDLFQRFPELRHRLEQLNHRRSTLQRSPAQPGSPHPQPNQPPTRRPQGQDIPLRPPAAPHPPAQRSPSPPPAPSGQSGRSVAETALAIAGVVVGSVAGTAARGAARMLRALGR